MKRVLVLSLIMAATLLCFAMPAIASPPTRISEIEAFGPAANIYSVVALEIAQPIIAATSPGIALISAFVAGRISSTSPFNTFIYAIAAVLVGLMPGAYVFIAALYKRMRRSRGIANGQGEARRWV